MNEAEARAALVQVLATHSVHEIHDMAETVYVTIGCWAIDTWEAFQRLAELLAEQLKPMFDVLGAWWQANGPDVQLAIALPEHVAGLERLAIPALPAPKMPPLFLKGGIVR